MRGTVLTTAVHTTYIIHQNTRKKKNKNNKNPYSTTKIPISPPPNRYHTETPSHRTANYIHHTFVFFYKTNPPTRLTAKKYLYTGLQSSLCWQICQEQKRNLKINNPCGVMPVYIINCVAILKFLSLRDR